MLWRYEPDKFRFNYPCVARFLPPVNAEMRVDVSLTVFRSPSSSACWRERHRHPYFPEVLSVPMQRWWVREIVPFKKVPRSQNVVEHEGRSVWRAFETVWNRRRQPEAEEILITIGDTLLRAGIACVVR